MGRPTKYTKDIPQKLNEYISTYSQYGDIIPSAEGFACTIGIGRRTIYDWAGKHVEFSHMLDKLNAAQARAAISKGLTGDWNATIVKLLLSKHGYSDKHEITGSEGGPIQVSYDKDFDGV